MACPSVPSSSSSTDRSRPSNAGERPANTRRTPLGRPLVCDEDSDERRDPVPGRLQRGERLGGVGVPVDAGLAGLDGRDGRVVCGLEHLPDGATVESGGDVAGVVSVGVDPPEGGPPIGVRRREPVTEGLFRLGSRGRVDERLVDVANDSVDAVQFL